MRSVRQWPDLCARCAAPPAERATSVENLADLQVQRALVVLAESGTQEYRSQR